jgi:hypothetical protein
LLHRFQAASATDRAFFKVIWRCTQVASAPTSNIGAHFNAIEAKEPLIKLGGGG